jgi:outer membrane protein OmpA-like peptidoglycan-associated protein
MRARMQVPFFSLMLLACVAVVPAAPAHAQVLKGSQVTEEALVDALEIDGPEVAPEGKTRGFRPVAGAPTKPQPTAARTGKANLMITFQVDSAELTPEGVKTLDTVARALQSDKLAGFMFRIEGHADPRGSAERNMVLSEQRAQSVVNYLITNHGVLPERLTAVGKGSSELFDPRQPDAPENRRVTIVTTR